MQCRHVSWVMTDQTLLQIRKPTTDLVLFTKLGRNDNMVSTGGAIVLFMRFYMHKITQ